MTEARLTLRAARADDLDLILTLLRDDVLGATRESDGRALYEHAFAEILADPNADMLLAALGDQIIGCAQVNRLANLSLQSTKRANIEGVRIASNHRGCGYGERFLQMIEGHCRDHGCGLMQLTTNKARDEALRFYSSQGFEDSHIGLKKRL
ncbi:transcriptional regulator [Rhodobacteraceae bacterium KLH11]|nr:transcriptional regulator [Rhodobacteraceae bacterium KLH11]